MPGGVSVSIFNGSD